MVTRSQPAGTRRKARESAPARPARRRATTVAPATDSPVGPSLLMSLARQVQAWSGSILGGVGTATDVAMTLAQSKLQRPGPKAAVSKAAALLRDLREAAGLTVEDLGRLLELEVCHASLTRIRLDQTATGLRAQRLDTDFHLNAKS